MIAHPHLHYMTPAEYLEWEAKQELRHEYLDGEVYAMTGGTLAHNTVAINLTTLIRQPVRNRNCRVFMADAKVQLSPAGNPYFYPDVAVTCHSDDKQATQFLQHPCLIIEVLSPGTEAYDRGVKFSHYRRLTSLQEYVLVSSDRINVEIFRLNDRGKWELTPYGSGEMVLFASIDFGCEIEKLYDDVIL